MSRNLKLLACLLVALGSARLLWPADISMTDDEPSMLQMALDHNQAGTWASHTLTGTRGIAYGPFAIWIYQVALRLTHNLVAIVFFKTLFLTLLMGGIVYWLATRYRFLVPIVGVITMGSPYLWRYSRDLWDNCFLSPLIGALFVCVLEFSRKPRAWLLIAMGVAAGSALSLHLMSLGVIAGACLYLLAFYWRELLRFWPATLGSVLVVIAILMPYLLYLDGGGFSPMAVRGSFASFWFAFYMARIFSAVGFEYILQPFWFFFTDNLAMKGIFGLMAILSISAFLFFFYGLYLSAKITFQHWREKSRPKVQLASLALFMFLGHWFICFRMSLVSHPHYYNPAWIVALVLIWLGASDLWQKAWGRRLFYSYATSTLILTLGLILSIHLHSGDRGHRYGPTLGNQIEMAQILGRYYPETPIIPETYHSQTYSHSYRFLRRLYYSSPNQDSMPKVALIIRYQHPDDPRSALTEVVEP